MNDTKIKHMFLKLNMRGNSETFSLGVEIVGLVYELNGLIEKEIGRIGVCNV